MRLVIESQLVIPGRGLVVSGKADTEPKTGKAVLWLKDGTTHPVEVNAVEHDGQGSWWSRGVGLWLSPSAIRQLDLVGAVIEQKV